MGWPTLCQGPRQSIPGSWGKYFQMMRIPGAWLAAHMHSILALVLTPPAYLSDLRDYSLSILFARANNSFTKTIRSRCSVFMKLPPVRNRKIFIAQHRHLQSWSLLTYVIFTRALFASFGVSATTFRQDPKSISAFFGTRLSSFLGHVMIDQTRCVFRESYTRHHAQAQCSNKRQFFSYTYDRNWSLSQPLTHHSRTPYMTIRRPQLQQLQPLIHALKFHVGSHATPPRRILI